MGMLHLNMTTGEICLIMIKARDIKKSANCENDVHNQLSMKLIKKCFAVVLLIALKLNFVFLQCLECNLITGFSCIT